MNRRQRREDAAKARKANKEKIPYNVNVPAPFQHIMDSLKRGSGTWALMKHGDDKFSVALGSPKAVRVPNGFIVVLQLTREELSKLWDAADDMLAGITPASGVPEAVDPLADTEPSPQVDRPKCEECGGDLGGTEIGRLEDHKPGCSLFPL